MIVNNDASYQKGEHWIACCYDAPNNRILVYDSFGRKTNNLVPQLRRLYPNIVDAEYDAEQKYSEDNCGQRCLAFLYCYDKYGWDEAQKI
jgi:hypothetical protein